MTTEPTLPTTGVQSLSPSHHNQMDDSELSKLYHSSKEIVWVIVAENVKPKFDTFEIHATGFSVAPNGVIMTCAHIFRQYSVSDLKIKVRKLSDQNKGFVQATVQSIFPHFDVAILKAQDVNDSKYGILASDGSLESGETIFHIGHSAQLIGSFLVGRAGYQCIEDVIIPSMDGLTCDRYETDVYEVTPRYRIKGHYLNTDADYDFDFDKHLHPLIPVIQCNGLNCREGSSGGPLFNTRGEIVGMYVSVFRGYDIGVHVTLLRTLYQQQNI